MAIAMHGPHSQHIVALVKKLEAGSPEDDLLPLSCAGCGKMQEPGEKTLQCSACKAVRYCNATCAKRDWNGVVTPRGVEEPHRNTCPNLRNSMMKAPDMRAIAKQFPWVREQKDGTFEFLILRSSLNLAGTGRNFGRWTERPCCNDRTQYISGSMLLETQHLRERQGWLLPGAHIPWLDFSESPQPPPRPLPAEFEHTWQNCYGWRGLPIESLSCLLLHWPLTVFRLLHLLHLAPSKIPSQRRQLIVHYLGAEKELDFLPIYGELALLLPNTDLDLVFFGPGVPPLPKEAKKKPGGGQFWDGVGLKPTSKLPDAMIACNAGLSSYMEWKPAVVASRALSIPFAVTDFNEISVRSDISLVFKMLPMWAGMVQWPVGRAMTRSEQQRVEETPGAHFELGLNPFMHLGPRQEVNTRVPSSVSGFEMVVTPAGAHSSIQSFNEAPDPE
ncbi:uncharacterized protein FIBRA_06740 [Fibroporia radiculosa]|uniref:MYND-type domain-containing protein n=1 Tax=Fibroporia radiculosa TaxID=599839 RepID=J4H486_9APHY|nr:uncharacterized protein FIBRA_06740 [Fibroporia radiculosa]CCM04559.1 predicted protein [Fibroporia radiculosa]